jgi:maleamate amidohydrolase
MAGQVGWGARPALVVVDLQAGFTDPACPLGGNLDAVVASAARLIEAARSAGVPVVYTLVRYQADLSDGGVWPLKLPAQRHLVEGSRWVELDVRLGYREGEKIVVKRHASAFFGTGLADHLTGLGTDTVVVCGCTTSGCVRASAVDSCGLGFKTLVVREAVGDRHPLVHEVSLFDLDAKYADVIDEKTAVSAMLERSQR